MNVTRTENASRNIFYGGVLKAYQVLIPFVMRTAMIHFMGIQYLGLNSLFTSILQVLNLAELGVGAAIVYSMYKPIAENDSSTICALMNLYRKYYNIIGAVIAIFGIVVTPFIPKLIKGEIPQDINIYILYLMNLGVTVLSYWLYAYKGTILQVHQRSDMVSRVSLITSTFQYGAQFLILWLVRDYYLYIVVKLAAQIMNNIIIAAIAAKMYPNYKAAGTLDKFVVKNINQRIKDLFTSKIGGIVVNSADTIVISAFLGLTALAAYQNYYFILTAVIGFIDVIFFACTAGIGNSLVIESKEKNFNDLKKFTFMILWIAGFCSCCFLNLFQTFIEIWVGKNLKLEFSAVICFCIYFYIYEINRLLSTYKDAGGIWHQDRFRPLVTALANLAMNLIMVQFWGIYGVLLSTILSMFFIDMPWILYNLFTSLFEKKQLMGYIKLIFSFVAAALISCIITWFICNFINAGLWFTLVLRAGICCMIPNVFYYLIYHNTIEFHDCILMLDRMTKGRLHLSKLIE